MKLLSQFSATMNINEIKVSYNRNYYFDGFTITNSDSAFECLKKIYDMDCISFREYFYVVFLDNRKHVLGYYMLGCGGLNFVAVDVKLIFILALKTACDSIIISHNHPSGKLNPSNEDIAITKKTVEAGVFLGIKVLDHIIVSENSYYSFRDEGLI